MGLSLREREVDRVTCEGKWDMWIRCRVCVNGGEVKREGGRKGDKVTWKREKGKGREGEVSRR